MSYNLEARHEKATDGLHLLLQQPDGDFRCASGKTQTLQPELNCLAVNDKVSALRGA